MPAPARPPDPAAIIHQTWRLYLRCWRPLLGLAAVVFGPATLAIVGLQGLGLPPLLASVPVTFAALAIGHGALVWSVDRSCAHGTPPPMREALGQAGQRWATLIIGTVLAAISICLGLVALIVPGLVLLTWWMLLLPVLMLERAPLWVAFRRARSLVLGHGWPVLGVACLTLLIQLAFSLALGLVLTPLDSSSADALGAAVGNTLAAPFVAIAWTLTYHALRTNRPPR